MFRIFLGILFILEVINPVTGQEIKVGERAPASENMQLLIRNPKDISAAWKNGGTCTTQRAGTFTLIGADGNRVLVLYEIGGSMSNIIWCPNGAISFITRIEWGAALKASEARRSEEVEAEKDRSIVQKLLEEYLKK